MMSDHARISIFDLDFSELDSIVESWGVPGYRARQIWQGLYQNLWKEPGQFTTLPNELRLRLGEKFTFSQLRAEQALKSSDRETEKTLFRLPDQRAVETVLMRYKQRRTLCISTQAGCAMGCVFCATGQMGFQRNLTSSEIVEQVIFYARQLQEINEKITNVVVMGMGEPFHNYDATLRSIDRLAHPAGMALGARRFTISTVGLVPAIRRFTSERRQINLAISLHAADDEHREALLPIDKKYPISEVIQACHEYVNQTRRRITFEWALIKDVNDNADQARSLARLLQGLLCHVNVIPLNPTHGYMGQATTRQRALAFKAELERHGIPCSIRLRRGIDIQAGCGQLAIQTSPVDLEIQRRPE
jgi:23S rRNA (adenine2503-C2)-methyltransferase